MNNNYVKKPDFQPQMLEMERATVAYVTRQKAKR